MKIQAIAATVVLAGAVMGTTWARSGGALRGTEPLTARMPPHRRP